MQPLPLHPHPVLRRLYSIESSKPRNRSGASIGTTRRSRWGCRSCPTSAGSLWEPDGRLWAEWVNGQPGLRAVSIFCGGRRIHAEGRAHRETVEDIALFHQAVRPEVAFVLGGVHSPRRLLDYRRAAPGRRLAVCNGQAYALAQRRRLLSGEAVVGGLSARTCFLRNCSWIEEAYAAVLGRTSGAV
jgi:hypothetical protein